VSDAKSLYTELIKAALAFRNLAQQNDSRLKREAARRLREATQRACKYIERR
jgi:hypothetical protein